MSRAFEIGDRVVYAKHKRSENPSRWAREVHPDSGGDGYSYIVDKYWTFVDADEEKGTVTCATKGGKRNEIAVDDPRLRRASWVEHIVYKYHPGDEHDPKKRTFPDSWELFFKELNDAQEAGEDDD